MTDPPGGGLGDPGDEGTITIGAAPPDLPAAAGTPEPATEGPAPSAPGRRSAFDRFGPIVPVIGVVIFNLVQLWQQTTVVAFPDDSAMHSEMTRFATDQYRAGHFPLNGWFPFLNVGSPNFLHYQSLPAMITGLAGVAVGPDHAYAWSLYLLVATWPISVFIGGRLLRLPPWAATVAACMAPFVVSVPSLGYEQASYLWIGYGLWTQLWAMWALPLAWGFTWRALTEGRHLFAATFFVALTMCLHFMTGYLALAPFAVFLLANPRLIPKRIGRAVGVAVASLVAAAWVVVPLLRMSKYAAVNEFLQHTSHADSFGARRVLSWLAEGDLFDARRLPVITVFLGLGLLACLIRAVRDERARALIGLFVVSLVLFFGRPTLGPLLHLLPGSRDLFLRRFIMGVQLSGLFIAGLGAVALGRAVAEAVVRLAPRFAELAQRRRVVPLRRVLVILAGVATLLPAFIELGSYDSSNARDIRYQATADATQGAQVDALIARLHSLPPGRVYAGLPVYNWGDTFDVGYVQVLQYLTTENVDEIGFTLRSASLMSNPEAYFDEYNLGDYHAFGVRYLILPAGHKPPVAADLVMRRGDYLLWSVPGIDYVQVVDTVPPITLDRGDIGQQTAWFLRSSLPTEGLYPTVAYQGGKAATPTSEGRQEPKGPAGSVLSESPDLTQGRLTATVDAHRRAVVLLSASYDPGWTVTVDGRPAQTEMVAPALVGVEVPAGVHVVSFVFRGTSGYPILFGVSLLALVLMAAVELWRWKGRRGRRRQVGESGGSVLLEPPPVGRDDLDLGSRPDEALHGVEDVGHDVPG